MRIIDKLNSEQEIVDLIISKAKYQKVIICIDETSNMKFINALCDKIAKHAVIIKYYCTGDNQDFFTMINDGVRVVVYNVSNKHFYQLENKSNLILNIFISQSNFLLPYIDNIDSVYGDNILVCDTTIKDYTSIVIMYELAFFKLWNELLQNIEVDIGVFKRVDRLVNKQENFYSGLAELLNDLKYQLTDGYKQVAKEQVPHYIYLRLSAVAKMLNSIYCNQEEYIDFYKTAICEEDVKKAYNLILKNNVIEKLKSNSANLIKICLIILNRIKTIIKNNFNLKNIEFIKLNNLIAKQSKLLNIDNLLYISYIFNSI